MKTPLFIRHLGGNSRREQSWRHWLDPGSACGALGAWAMSLSVSLGPPLGTPLHVLSHEPLCFSALLSFASGHAETTIEECERVELWSSTALCESNSSGSSAAAAGAWCATPLPVICVAPAARARMCAVVASSNAEWRRGGATTALSLTVRLAAPVPGEGSPRLFWLGAPGADTRVSVTTGGKPPLPPPDAVFSRAHGHALRASYLASCCAPLADSIFAGEAADIAAADDWAGAGMDLLQFTARIPAARCTCTPGAPMPPTFAESSLHHLLGSVPLPAGMDALFLRMRSAALAAAARDSPQKGDGNGIGGGGGGVDGCDGLGLGLMPEPAVPSTASAVPEPSAFARALAAAADPATRGQSLLSSDRAPLRPPSEPPFLASIITPTPDGETLLSPNPHSPATSPTMPPQAPQTAEAAAPAAVAVAAATTTPAAAVAAMPGALVGVTGGGGSGSFRSRRAASSSSWHSFSLASMCGFSASPQRGPSWRVGAALEKPAVSSHVVVLPAVMLPPPSVPGGRPPMHHHHPVNQHPHALHHDSFFPQQHTQVPGGGGSSGGSSVIPCDAILAALAPTGDERAAAEAAFAAALLQTHILARTAPHSIARADAPAVATALLELLVAAPVLRSGSSRVKLVALLQCVDAAAAAGALDRVGRLPPLAMLTQLGVAACGGGGSGVDIDDTEAAMTSMCAAAALRRRQLLLHSELAAAAAAGDPCGAVAMMSPLRQSSAPLPPAAAAARPSWSPLLAPPCACCAPSFAAGMSRSPAVLSALRRALRLLVRWAAGTHACDGMLALALDLLTSALASAAVPLLLERGLAEDLIEAYVEAPACSLRRVIIRRALRPLHARCAGAGGASLLPVALTDAISSETETVAAAHALLLRTEISDEPPSPPRLHARGSDGSGISKGAYIGSAAPWTTPHLAIEGRHGPLTPHQQPPPPHQPTLPPSMQGTCSDAATASAAASAPSSPSQRLTALLGLTADLAPVLLPAADTNLWPMARAILGVLASVTPPPVVVTPPSGAVAVTFDSVPPPPADPFAAALVALRSVTRASANLRAPAAAYLQRRWPRRMVGADGEASLLGALAELCAGGEAPGRLRPGLIARCLTAAHPAVAQAAILALREEEAARACCGDASVRRALSANASTHRAPIVRSASADILASFN